MRPAVCLLLVLTVFAGCTHPEQPPRSYRATVVSVRLSEWQHYTAEDGYGAQHELVLRVQPHGETFKLRLFDIYYPAVFGDLRDEIAFLYAGRLPVDGQLRLDQLKGYRIERRVP